MNAPIEDLDSDALRHELHGLLRYINRVRQEIASISRPADDAHEFGTMSDQLDAVIKATDDASNTIMACAEDNEEAVQKLRAVLTDPAQIALLDQISENDMNTIQACSFQDITGQRVTKVARSLTYVEDRVTALTELWGKDEIAKVEIKGEEKTEDEKLLHGPALDPTRAISQDEIDALFD
ncbi:protein phosphatase CheZ [Magnetovibrio sp.]|uniref:protein phosphatase CheZ n=1 Tax=Magnetovibrio sp. TaxID=2024836 RepID=UPI002F94FC02